MQFSCCTAEKSKSSEVFKTHFFDIVATHNDHSSYVKHVLGNIYVFFTLVGGWVLKVDTVRGGIARGNRISIFLCILAIHNHQISYVKMFQTLFVCFSFTLCGCVLGGGGGAPSGAGQGPSSSMKAGTIIRVRAGDHLPQCTHCGTAQLLEEAPRRLGSRVGFLVDFEVVDAAGVQCYGVHRTPHGYQRVGLIYHHCDALCRSLMLEAQRLHASRMATAR